MPPEEMGVFSFSAEMGLAIDHMDPQLLEDGHSQAG